MIEEIKNPQIIKLSASSIKTYEQCPRKYYFTYIEKAPKQEHDFFDLGNLCHETLETFHTEYMIKGGDKKGLSKMMGDAFSEARKHFPALSDTLVTDAKTMMADYLKVVQKNGMPIVKFCEKDFSFNISEDVMIRGFIDRMDITKDGKFRIMDYKTTKNAQYLEPFQLLVYGIWLKHEYPKMKEFTGAYVLLKHQSTLKEYNFNLIDIEETEKKLLSYAKNIKSENLWITIPGKLCNYCDFYSICPAQKGW